MTDQVRAQRLRDLREEALRPFRADASLRAQYGNNEEWYLAATAAIVSGRAKVLQPGAGLHRMTRAQWLSEGAK